MRQVNANISPEKIAISIRLPEPILSKLDKLAEQAESSRTDIIRRALATYFRLGSSVLIPISRDNREKLEEIAYEKSCSFELLAEELLANAIQEQAGTLTYTQVKIRTTQTIAFKVNNDHQKTSHFTYTDKKQRGEIDASQN